MTKIKTDFSERNVAIDILRALTMLMMIFVNDLWTISGYPEWLGHAKFNQDMLGLADIVFPCFLFAVGMCFHLPVYTRPLEISYPDLVCFYDSLHCKKPHEE